MMRAMKRGVLPIVCAVLWFGCKTNTGHDYPADLASENYVQRTKAAQEFVRKQDAAGAQLAFGLLTDDQITLRALAHMTLRDMSDGEDFGYRADLEEVDRWRVARRWRYWWESRRG